MCPRMSYKSKNLIKLLIRRATYNFNCNDQFRKNLIGKRSRSQKQQKVRDLGINLPVRCPNRQPGEQREITLSGNTTVPVKI